MEIPHRRFTVELKIHGDTWEDAMHELRFVFDEVERHGPTCGSCGGGGGAGHTVNIEERPGQTPEKYKADLEAWAQARKTEAKVAD